MSDIKILQVDIQGMDMNGANRFCTLLQDKVGNDIIIVACNGSSGKITSINAADIVYLPNSKKVTGEELYSAVMELRDLREENEDLRNQLNELSNEFISEYNNENLEDD